MFIIDRIEKNAAICETDDKSMISIPLEQLPPDCKEGSCMERNENGIYVLLEEETTERKKQMEERFMRLFQK
ncbi:DUF3006 domain-containing protein [uncultured Robinsoniella sp.]|uniref:DUF3006 domain-containing protein n=1 Tax=uncultured Robinsoniella sp. TaxID=904190 RepID=UPI00374E4F58